MPVYPNPQPNQDEVTARNKDIMRKLNQAFTVGDTTAIDQYISPNVVFHSPHVVRMEGRAIDGLKEEMLLPFEAFAQQTFREVDLIAEGDMVFLDWELTATHRGQLHGREGTGQPFMLHGGDIARISGEGKVIEHWDHFTKPRLESLIQLGLLDQAMLNQLNEHGLV